MIDLSGMTAQEVFDKVVAGLAGQGFERSMDEDNIHCQYKGQQNRKCAAGFLIPNEEYKKEWDQRFWPWDDLVRRKCTTDHHAELIFSLQAAHDGSTTPAMMKRELRIAGEAEGLNIPPVLF
jgi:hypothetical protein